MAAIELFGSRVEDWVLHGGTAQRIFRADNDTWAKDCPRLGDPYPGKPSLKLTHIHTEPLTPDPGMTEPAQVVKVICDYGTIEWLDTAPVENGEASGEVLELGLGRKWRSTGNYSVQGMGVVCPLMDITIKLIVAKLPKAAILKCVGKVNGYIFEGYPAETLLYSGASYEARYDYERKTYIYNVTHKFSFRPRGWNVFWRAPEQAREGGQLLFSGSQPVFATGPAGVGGWDRYVPDMSDWIDFNPLIGKPERPIIGPN